MERSMLNEIMGSLDNYPCVRDYRHVFEEYYNAFADYTPSEEDDMVLMMLKRRLFLPLNLSTNTNGILIVGANPSYTGKDDGNDENFMKTTDELYHSEDKHWKEIADLACLPSNYQAAYLDLFPIKQSDLGDFETIFRTHNNIRARLLQVTHERMLAIQPKVIINLFAMTSYYWGFKADAPDYCNEKNPWMGYKFKKIEAEGLDAYEIIGWTDSEQSILPNNEAGRLAKGTVIVFSTKAWNKQLREEKMVDKAKLQNLLHELSIEL
jgi:hypothetical protein